MVTTIQKWGNSQGIRIPKPILEKVEFSENEEVEVIARGEGIFIKKAYAKKHRPLRQRLEEFYGKDMESILNEHAKDYKPSEINWGAPVGDEVW